MTAVAEMQRSNGDQTWNGLRRATKVEKFQEKVSGTISMKSCQGKH
jgi:hypothetical protein